MAQIPVCTHRIGTLAIVEPDKQWWRELNLGSPEAIIKVFVQQSGCFTMVNRGRAMQQPGDGAGDGRPGRAAAAARTWARARSRRPIISSSPTSSAPTRIRAAAASARRPAALGGLFGGWRRRRRRARRRDQRQEGRGQRHAVAGQRPHHRGRSADRRLFPQDATSAGRAAAAPAGGAASRRPAAAATRIPRSARSSCSPISTPTRSWSPSSAAYPPAPRPRRRSRTKGTLIGASRDMVSRKFGMLAGGAYARRYWLGAAPAKKAARPAKDAAADRDLLDGRRDAERAWGRACAQGARPDMGQMMAMMQGGGGSVDAHARPAARLAGQTGGGAAGRSSDPAGAADGREPAAGHAARRSAKSRRPRACRTSSSPRAGC